jgi:hypothetical protein
LEGAFYVSKVTFYFFYSLYGGGPAVVENNYFKSEVPLKALVVNIQKNQFEEEASSNASNTPRKLTTQNNTTTMRGKALEDGIVGLHNNTFFCYMNACL